MDSLTLLAVSFIGLGVMFYAFAYWQGMKIIKKQEEMAKKFKSENKNDIYRK